MQLIESICEIPECGYITVNNILSNRVAVLFSVPSHEWNKLEQSKEWKNFQALFEKLQISQTAQLYLDKYRDTFARADTIMQANERKG